jgi:hypothetical protein
MGLIPTHPVNIRCGKKLEHPLTDSFHINVTCPGNRHDVIGMVSTLYLLVLPLAGVDAAPNIKGEEPAVCTAVPKLNPPEGVLEFPPNWKVDVTPVLALKLKPPGVAPVVALVPPAGNKPDILPEIQENIMIKQG